MAITNTLALSEYTGKFSGSHDGTITCGASGLTAQVIQAMVEGNQSLADACNRVHRQNEKYGEVFKAAVVEALAKMDGITFDSSSVDPATVSAPKPVGVSFFGNGVQTQTPRSLRTLS